MCKAANFGVEKILNIYYIKKIENGNITSIILNQILRTNFQRENILTNFILKFLTVWIIHKIFLTIGK